MTDSSGPPLRSGIYALSVRERRELAQALLARPHRDSDGRSALRDKYPHVPLEMINTATHHLFVDGPSAVVDFLADAELAIRDNSHEVDYGPAFELLYHVYNWLQFRALLPEGRQDILDLVKQLREAVDQNDQEYLKATVAELEDVVQGTRSPPDFSF